MIEKLKNVTRSIKESKKYLKMNQLQNLRIERMVSENNWSNVFNSAINGSKWFKDVPLNVGRWAANYSLLYVLYRILNEINPENILEFGLGETTKMLQVYKQCFNRNSNCITIEQDDLWIDMRLNNGISGDFITIIQADVINTNINSHCSSMYDQLVEKLEPLDLKFDLILIDGPIGSTNYSRYNIIELIEQDLLSENFIIIMDDYERRGEQQTIEQVIKLLRDKKFEFVSGCYSGAKDQFLICCKKYQYLTTL